MKKVLIISPYKQGDGYAKAAIEYMMALSEVGVDVVARFVEMTPNRGVYPDKIKEFEAKDLNNVDAVIQHNLPSEFVYKSGVHNIGSFAYETTGFPNTNWKDHLDLMDSIVVFCKDQKRVLGTISQSLFDKTAVIPHPVNVSKFKQKYEKIDFGLPRNTLKFYTIAEFSKRKNFAALLAAYLSEFDSSDNVVLVIKTHVPTRDPATSSALLKGMIQEVKNNIGRFHPQSDRYPNIVLLTDYMTNEQINALHNSCDVFVSSSHAESFCLPFVDAIGFGKPTIVPKHTAFLDYQYDHKLFVHSTLTPVINTGGGGVPGLYTSDEKWYNISLSDLREKMRLVYDNQRLFIDEGISEARKLVVEKTLSREVIGNQYKNLILSKLQ